MRHATLMLGVSLCIVISGCEHLMPVTDSSRKERAYHSTAEAEAAFNKVEAIGHNTHMLGTNEVLLRGGDLRFGIPYSAEETVGPLRIALVLTGNTGDKAFDMLDSEIKACILLVDAASDCKMVVFTDQEANKHGVGKNVIGRAVGLTKHDISSSWWWKSYFVLQKVDGSWFVIHKQFEKGDNPEIKDDKWLPALENASVNLTKY